VPKPGRRKPIGDTAFARPVVSATRVACKERYSQSEEQARAWRDAAVLASIVVMTAASVCCTTGASAEFFTSALRRRRVQVPGKAFCDILSPGDRPPPSVVSVKLPAKTGR